MSLHINSTDWQRMLGIVDTPNLEAGSLCNIARPADTRLVMHLWQHLPVTNRPRRGWSALLPPKTRPALNCRVLLDVIDEHGGILFSRTGGAVFGSGVAGPLESFTIGRNETALIPVYIQLPESVRAFWVPGGVRVEAGTYLTSADFLYRGQLIGGLRVPAGAYTVRVRIQHDDGEFAAPPIPLVVPDERTGTVEPSTAL